MNAASGQAPAPVARGTAWKILLSVVAVAGAVGILYLCAAAPGMEYYHHVDEVMAKVDSFRGKRLQVHGNVVKGSILRRGDTLDYKFKLETKAPRAASGDRGGVQGSGPRQLRVRRRGRGEGRAHRRQPPPRLRRRDFRQVSVEVRLEDPEAGSPRPAWARPPSSRRRSEVAEPLDTLRRPARTAG